MLDRFVDWLSREPAAALLLFAAAAGVFVTHFRTTPHKPFERRLLAATAYALLLMALAVGFRAALNSVSDAFQATHGGSGELSDLTAKDLWGEPVQQRELVIFQQREEEVQMQIPRADPNAAPEFRSVKMLVTTPQYSITRFQGDVQMRLGEREKDGQRYRGYLADVTLLYDIRNDTAAKSDMQFDLAMSYPYSEYQDVAVWVDDRPVSPAPHVLESRVTWSTTLKPGQASTIRVKYVAAGTDSFLYQILGDHPIHDSQLSITVDRLSVEQLRPLPDGSAPTEIRPSNDGRGSVLIWKLDRAAASTSMGVSLPKAEQPGAQVLLALQRSPKAVILFAGLLALTMLIGRGRVDFIDLAFFLVAYTMQFLAMAVVSDVLFGFWGGLLALLMAFLWTRMAPGQRGMRWLLFALFAIFTPLVPLSSLLGMADQQNAYQVYLQIGLVLFLSVLWVVTQRKPGRSAKAG